MKFEELPHEVQLIAAQVLADRMPPSSVGAVKQEIEPAVKLARDVRDAFIELYSLPGFASVQNDSDQTGK